MLDHGYPCPGCYAENFRKAVLKAEATHGLVSAPGALFVRWVEAPSRVLTPLMVQSVFFIIISAFIAFLVFYVLGSLTWYYGLGKRDGLADGLRLWPKQNAV